MRGRFPNSAGIRGSNRPKTRPAVLLYGGDAGAILAACYRAARRAGWTPSQLRQFHDEATAGDYAHLLEVVAEFFDPDLDGAG